MMPSTLNQLDSTSDEHLINEVVDEFARGWNLHDVEIFCNVFADDADFTNVKGVRKSGRQAIAELHEPLFKSIWSQSELSITKIISRFIKADVASVDAWWALERLKDPQGVDVPPRNGLLHFIMTRRAGKWSIEVMHNMDLPGSVAQKC